MAKADIRQYLELTQEPFYPDTGCEVATACLDCPLSRCKHDDPEWYTLGRQIGRDLAIHQEMIRDGLSVSAAAFRFGVLRRTIYRIKQRCREVSIDMSPQDMQVFAVLPPVLGFGERRRQGAQYRKFRATGENQSVEVSA